MKRLINVRTVGSRCSGRLASLTTRRLNCRDGGAVVPVYYRLRSYSDCNRLENIRYRLNSLKWALRFDNPGEFIYVFNHIPKAGGTAVRQVFEQWGAVIGDYRTDTSDIATARFMEDRINVEALRRPAFVCGHYGLEGAYLDQRYPGIFDSTRYRLITFLREPLEIAVSTYFYAKRVGQRVAAADLGPGPAVGQQELRCRTRSTHVTRHAVA